MICESEARCSRDQRCIRFYEEKIAEYSQVFAQSKTAEELMRSLRQKQQSSQDQGSNITMLDRKVLTFVNRLSQELMKESSNMTDFKEQ
jgi:hypothetical protein